MPDDPAQPDPAPPRVVLYTAQDCGLCATARGGLARLAARHRFAWVAIDIASDPALERRYLLEVPVVAVDGIDVCRGALDAVAVRRAVLGQVEHGARGEE